MKKALSSFSATKYNKINNASQLIHVASWIRRNMI